MRDGSIQSLSELGGDGAALHKQLACIRVYGALAAAGSDNGKCMQTINRYVIILGTSCMQDRHTSIQRK